MLRTFASRVRNGNVDIVSYHIRYRLCFLSLALNFLPFELKKKVHPSLSTMKKRAVKTPRVAVLGGGPCGLSAAYRLVTDSMPIHVDVYEASSRFGGVITTESAGGFLYELGPPSLTPKHPAVADLVLDKLQLSSRVEKRNPDANQFFILKNGSLFAFPTSPVQFFRSKLLSWRAKCKVLVEPFVPRARRNVAEQESVKDFFSRRFGNEVVQYVIDPASAGIFSSTPANLSMKHAFSRLWNMERKNGSVIVGMLRGATKPSAADARYTPKQLRDSFSFDGGMQLLTSTIIDRIQCSNKKGRLYKNAKVRTLEKDVNGTWRVNGRGSYDAVISTIPAHSLASIHTNMSTVEAGFKKLTKRIHYAPASIVLLGFNKSQFPARLQGYGALLPSSEGRNILGVNYSSSVFPGRVQDPNHVYLTVYVGGKRNPDLPFRPAQEVVDISTKEVQQLLGVTGNPFYSRVKSWTQGIPQYTPGYDKVLSTMARIERYASGLILAGNYRYGVGISDALLSGINSAERIVEYLNRKTG